MRRLAGGLTLAVVVSLFLISIAVTTKAQNETATPAETTATQGPQPTIVIEEMRHDMGEVFETDKYKHVFKVKNIGDAELIIKNVKPG